jgi:hypothetical protein
MHEPTDHTCHPSELLIASEVDGCHSPFKLARVDLQSQFHMDLITTLIRGNDKGFVTVWYRALKVSV